MDISRLSVNDLMCLPDNAFGERFAVTVSIDKVWGAALFGIADVAFPERVIVWEFSLVVAVAAVNTFYIRVGLGDQKPTVEADFDKLRPFIQGLGGTGPECRKICLWTAGSSLIVPMRKFLHTGGQRLCLGIFAGAAADLSAHCLTVVSSVPNEVPDWVISGQAKSPL